MICSWCGSEAPEAPCPVCASDPLLDGRYRLESVLGERGSTKTYRGVALASEQTVVVKELLIRAAQTAKEIELFEREATLLERLDHPGVPAFIDHFELRRGKQLGLYLVQEHVTGTSLETKLADDRFSQTEVARIMAGVLDILTHLRAHDVVHRDLKPSNILQTDDGVLFVVDFGAGRSVAESLHRAGSTITGTFGYMAPEQLLGEAGPGSDVYGLGATAIRLLTRQEPGAFLGDDGRLHWRAETSVDPGLGGLIDQMLAVTPDARPDILDQVSNDLERFAGGSARALSAYQRAVIVHGGIGLARPTVGALSRHMIRRVGLTSSVMILFLALFGVGLLSAGVPAEQLVLFLILAVVAWIATYIRGSKVWKQWRLGRTGVAGRAVVTERKLLARKFFIETELRVGGHTYVERHEVNERRYLQIDTGDEVEVFYDPEDPYRGVLAAVVR